MHGENHLILRWQTALPHAQDYTGENVNVETFLSVLAGKEVRLNCSFSTRLI